MGHPRKIPPAPNRGHGHTSHPQGQHQHDHDDHRHDGDEHLPHEVLDGVAHHLALVADDVDVHVVGQRSLVVADDLLHLRAKLDDVGTACHLQRQQDAPLPVVPDVLARVRILTLDGGDEELSTEAEGFIEDLIDSIDTYLWTLNAVVPHRAGVDDDIDDSSSVFSAAERDDLFGEIYAFLESWFGGEI